MRLIDFKGEYNKIKLNDLQDSGKIGKPENVFSVRNTIVVFWIILKLRDISEVGQLWLYSVSMGRCFTSLTKQFTKHSVFTIKM